MVVDAEARLAALAHLNEMPADSPLFKISNDPRLTRIGAVLRRYSLDELPQLFNVVGGSMALVGPRPPLPAEVARYTEEMRRRLAVKPGLTGLWQISGRSTLSGAESVRLDLSYVENWSPSLDAMILLRTTTAVVRGEGAY
jgi:lipopolysaccharide/colanic/teichoic acid biosynthesis glycosyltransferase